jgi:chorismate mutase
MTLRALVHRWLGTPTTRAIRGAITVPDDRPSAIGDAVQDLLAELERRNGLEPGDVVSAIFTMTPDLVSTFPAEAARRAGWDDVPLLCATEIAVPGAMPRCIRVLLHVERAWGQRVARHAYLRDAARLRPDLAGDLPTVRDAANIPALHRPRVTTEVVPCPSRLPASAASSHTSSPP